MKIVRHFTFLLLAVAVLTANVLAQQQVPNPPREFSASSQQIQGTNLYNITLSWLRSTSDDTARTAIGYKVYRANTATEDVNQFDIIADVTQPVQGDYFRYIIERLGPGTYSFFVRAYNNNGLSDRSAIKVITITENGGGDNVFRFTTQPGTNVGLGGNYRYEAHAVHPNQDANSHIRYKIVFGPDGMTIDPVTGVITWTAPQTAKTVEVKIAAYLDYDESKIIYQSWVIHVGGDNNNGGDNHGCARLTGTVRDENGNYMNGTVTAYRVNDNGTLQDGLYRATLQNGRFTLSVPAGTYVLRAAGENFSYEWYENVKEGADAHRFTIACNDTVEVNFEVTALPQEQKFVFSGRVTDASTSQGISGTVYFYRVINGALGGDPIIVRTNQEGYYEVQLSNRYTYIAMARGSNDEYLSQYFNGVSTPTQATVLTPTANRNDINFALSMRQQYNNGLSGKLIDSAGTGIPGRVVAYLIVARNNEQGLERYRTVETDASGNYTISNLVPGDYVLMGIPNSRPFVPGYYKEGTYAVLHWRDGTVITMGTSVLSGQFNIKLHIGDGRRGIIRLNGRVDGRIGMMKGGNQEQGTGPLSGVFVVVTDNNGKIVDYAFTNVDGSYEINELPLGANSVSADKPAYDYSAQSLTFNSTSFTVTKDIQLQQSISSVFDEAVTNVSISPNPSSLSAHLTFVSTEGLATVAILNSLGVEVSSGTVSLTNGNNAVEINTSDLSVGAYFVRIAIGTKNTTLKLTVVR